MTADLKDNIKKASVLVEALPYIKKFHGNIVVIKYGGNAMIDEDMKKRVFEDLTLMKLVGIHPVLVHGGGPEINKMLDIMGVKSEFINGLRVSDDDVIDVIKMVLLGKVNTDIVSGINKVGGKAIGINGKDANMIMAKKYTETIEEDGIKKEIDFGYVGYIDKINTEVILDLIEKDYIPVIAPVGSGADGETFNINGDTMAGEVASALKANKYILLTDTEGIYKDYENNNLDIYKKLTSEKIEQLIEEGTISGGMIPKVRSCLKALKNGVEKIHIIDGRLPHSTLLELFTNSGIGTMIE